jgi:transposase
VTAASVSDNTGGIHLLSQISATSPRVTKAWADTGYRTKAIDHGARLGIDVEVVQRDPGIKGFKVIPRRWVVERTFGWLMQHRRLARDYEAHPHRSEAMTHVAMIDLMSRRLTRESTRTGATPEPRTKQPRRDKTLFNDASTRPRGNGQSSSHAGNKIPPPGSQPPVHPCDSTYVCVRDAQRSQRF